MSTLLSPVVAVLTAVLARAHALASGLGLPPESMAAWLLALAILVACVRTAMLPLVVHGVRASHARARALPKLAALQRRYAGRRDLESLTRLRAEQRRINAEHGVSTMALAPALLQLPLFSALYVVISDLSAGHPIGTLDRVLVASAVSASIYGFHLTGRLTQLNGGLPALGIMLGLASIAAAASYLGQRWFAMPNLPDSGVDQPVAMVALMGWLPALSAVGILVGATVVPAGLLAYWCLNNLWTFAQQGLIWRFWPTPGSPAAARRLP